MKAHQSPASAVKSADSDPPDATTPAFVMPAGLRSYYGVQAPIQADSEDGAKVSADPRAAFAEATAGAGREVPHRAEMERSFGRDFSSVKAFTGQGRPLGAMGARAAARANQVAFAAQQPDAKVVAHELTHVVQQEQTPGGVAASSTVSDSSHAAEVEARSVSDQVAAGARVSVSAAPGPGLHLEKLEELQKLIKGGEDEDEERALKIVALVKSGGEEKQAMVGYLSTMKRVGLAGQVWTLLHGKEEDSKIDKPTNDNGLVANTGLVSIAELPMVPREPKVKDLGGFVSAWGALINKIVIEQIESFPTVVPVVAVTEKKEKGPRPKNTVDPAIVQKGVALIKELCRPDFSGQERELFNQLLKCYGERLPPLLRNRILEFLAAKVLWMSGITIQPGEETDLKPDYKIDTEQGPKLGDCFHIGGDVSLLEAMQSKPTKFSSLTTCKHLVDVFNATLNGICEKVNKYDRGDTVVVIELSDAPWLDPAMLTWMCSGAPGLTQFKVKTLPLKMLGVFGNQCFDLFPSSASPGWQLTLLANCVRDMELDKQEKREARVEELKKEQVLNDKIEPCQESFMELDAFLLKYLSGEEEKRPGKLEFLKKKQPSALEVIALAVKVCANDRKAVMCIGEAFQLAEKKGDLPQLRDGLIAMIEWLKKNPHVRGDFPARFYQMARKDKGSAETVASTQVEILFVADLLNHGCSDWEKLVGCPIDHIDTLQANQIEDEQTPEFKATMQDGSVQFIECKYSKPTKKMIQVNLKKAMSQVSSGPEFCKTLGIKGQDACNGLIRIDCIGPAQSTSTQRPKKGNGSLEKEEDIRNAIEGQFMQSKSRMSVVVIEVLYLDGVGKPQKFVYRRDPERIAQWDLKQKEKQEKLKLEGGKKNDNGKDNEEDDEGKTTDD